MKPSLVLLAHAPSADERAAEVALLLAALGYEVGLLPTAPRMRSARIAAAHRLVVLWSHDAARVPALRAAARRARAAGKLACVRLDATKPPARLCSGAAIPFPRGRASAHAWRQLLEDTSMSMEATSAGRPSRLSGLGAALALALIAAGAFYGADAAFAARVNGVVAQILP